MSERPACTPSALSFVPHLGGVTHAWRGVALPGALVGRDPSVRLPALFDLRFRFDIAASEIDLLARLDRCAFPPASAE